MAAVDGREYVPGGASEIDELMDLFGIWHEQRERTGTGANPSVMNDDD